MGWAPRDGLGGRHAAELGAVGAAGDYESGCTVAADECRVGVGDDVRLFERDVAVADRLPGVRGEEVLDEERHAAERTVGKIGACGGLAGVVEPADHDRVEAGSIPSMRSIAASSSSLGDTSPYATSAA